MLKKIFQNEDWAFFKMRKRLPRRLRWPVYFLVAISFTAGIIATDQPWFVSYKGNYWFPAFSSILYPTRSETIADEQSGNQETIQFDIAVWKEMQTDFLIAAPIPWSPSKPDKLNRDYCGPATEQFVKDSNGKIRPARFFEKHRLGTDQLGNDLLAGIIHGISASVKIGFFAAVIAALIGIILGAFAGYFGNDRLKISRSTLLFGIPGLVFGIFWAFQVRSFAITDAMAEGFFQFSAAFFWSCILVFITLFCFIGCSRFLRRIQWFEKTLIFPIDNFIQRFTEIFIAIPKLLLIFIFAALFRERSMYLVIMLIGLTHWTGIARLTRAEMFRTRDLPYIEAGRATGYPWYSIIFKHALPITMGVLFIEMAFLIAGSILAESSLSYLGIGMPVDAVTLGGLLRKGHAQPDAWWMIVFPGVCIFLLLVWLISLAEWARKNQRI
jgi:peptide/nickel transport system permease protein